MFSGSGIIHYDVSDGRRVTVSIEQSIADYYYSLIPKYYRALKPRYKAHVTVVSPIDEILNQEKWGIREGQIANFIYDPTILYENGYWWFNLWSIEMESIRKELGLSLKSRITIPPEGYSKCFHCTLGKDLSYELCMS
jgi:hypothetical protein